MKDVFKRMLGITPATAQADTQKETTEMVVENTDNAVLAAVDTSAVDVATLTDVLAKVTSQLADANLKIAELSAFAAAANQAGAKAIADALEVKMSARKVTVAAALGAIKADALMSVLGGMTDESFSTIMTAMNASAAVEEATPLFSEQGVDASVDLTKVQADSNGVMDYLKSKYTK